MSKDIKTLFEGRHELLDPLVIASTQLGQVYALQNTQRTAPVLPKVEYIPVTYGTFGLGSLFSWLGIETTTPSYIRQYRKYLDSIKPDMLVCLDFFRLSFWQAIRYVRANPNTRLFLYSETKRWPQNPLSRLVMKWFFRRLKRNIDLVHTIFVWTEQGKNFYTQYLPNIRVVLMPAAVNTDLFIPSNEKVWLPEGVLRILVNARYASYKRHEDLLQACVLLQEQNKKIHVTLIGRADSGKERVRKRVDELGLQDHVTFLEPVAQANLPSIYHQHDVLVLPSYNEAVGMVVPEAMACGIPTITSDTVGANTYVQEGGTGLIFKTGDVKDLSECLSAMFDIDKLQKFGNTARKIVEDEYTTENTTQRFLEAIR